MFVGAIWAVERRRLGDKEPYGWRTTAYSTEREKAEHQYNLHLLYMQGHEIRLVGPGGAVVQHHRDAPASTQPTHSVHRAAYGEVLP